MSTLNYIDENGHINKAGCIPQNYPASLIKMANGESVEDALNGLIVKDSFTYTLGALSSGSQGWFEKSVAKSGYTPILATCQVAKTALVNGRVMLNGALSGNSFYGTYRAFDTVTADNSNVQIEVIYVKS